jgi:colicin import membrane protein
VNPALQSPLLMRRERLWPLVAVSLALHVGLGAAALLHRPPPQIDLGQKPIVAKLVRLGEKRPQNLLPRKEEPPAPPAPSPAPAPPVAEPKPAAPTQAPKVAVPSAKPAPAPAPKPAARPSPGGRDVLASVLSRVKRDKAHDEPVYGDPNGDPSGDSSEGSEGDQYLALVRRALRESYVAPLTIPERERIRLRAIVVLYIDGDGKILRHELNTPSGNSAFDAALERAVRGARLPPPPQQYRQRFRTEGLAITSTPSD